MPKNVAYAAFDWTNTHLLIGESVASHLLEGTNDLSRCNGDLVGRTIATCFIPPELIEVIFVECSTSSQ